MRLVAFLSQKAVIPSLIFFLVLSLIFPAENWKMTLLFVTLKAIAIPLVILGVMLNNDSVLFKLLEARICRSIGRLSYSLYLWQQLFLVWSTSIVLSMVRLQSFPLNLVAAIACAFVSMLLIEKPMISLGHRLSAQLTNRESRHR